MIERPSTDPNLRDIARKLLNERFSEDRPGAARLIDEAEDAANPSKGWKHVTARRAYGGEWLYTVRIGIGGRSRSIGYTRDAETAIRFADMATLFFWPYRQRGKEEPEDKSFNVSFSSAETDMLDNESMCNLLDEVANHFQDIGALGADGRDTKVTFARVRVRKPNAEQVTIEAAFGFGSKALDRRRALCHIAGDR